MAGDRISLDLKLRRPSAIPCGTWLDVLVSACCHQYIPHLRSFAIGPDHGQMCLGIEVDRPEAASDCRDSVVALVALLAQVDPDEEFVELCAPVEPV